MRGRYFNVLKVGTAAKFSMQIWPEKNSLSIIIMWAELSKRYKKEDVT